MPGYHITPRPVVEEILRLHIEEGYTYRLVEHGKVPKRPSSFLTPTADQYLALQKENRQLRMENELLRNFHQKLGKK